MIPIIVLMCVLSGCGVEEVTVASAPDLLEPVLKVEGRAPKAEDPVDSPDMGAAPDLLAPAVDLSPAPTPADMAHPPCGQPGQACCGASCDYVVGGNRCDVFSNRCTTAPCGGHNQACCGYAGCNGTYTCFAGFCK